MPSPTLPALTDGRIRIAAHGERVCRFLARFRGTPGFAPAIASTDMAEVPGISAAGETPEKRRYTADVDGEFLVRGRPHSLPDVPRNPLGPRVRR